MINLQFFPSRQIGLYTVKLFLTRSLAVLIALVLVLMTLDLLGESGKILAVKGNTDADLWRYVGLRLPLLTARFLPFSVLLGSLIAFVGLNQHSEIVSMKAAGISAHQILAPLIVASLGLAGLAFVFNETIVVNSARAVNAWSDANYEAVPPDTGVISNVWLLVGDDLARARRVVQTGQAVRIDRLSIYQRDGGRIERIIDAARATPQAGAWQLEDVRIYDPGMNLVTRAPTMTALTGVDPAQFTLAKVNPDERNFVSLKAAIGEMARAGRPTAAAQAGLWHKLSAPLSTVLMPLLAAVAAFGLARSGHVLMRATIGMALGFAYFVADNFSLAMGNVGAYSPLMAAWGPFLLFLLIGETVLIRSEE